MIHRWSFFVYGVLFIVFLNSFWVCSCYRILLWGISPHPLILLHLEKDGTSLPSQTSQLPHHHFFLFHLKILYILILSKHFKILISPWFPFGGGGGLYSVLKLFTGLATPALIAWKLTVNSVISKALMAAAIKIHQERLV